MTVGNKERDRERDDRRAGATQASAHAPAGAPFMERAEFLRRRRRSNRLIALALVAFCALVFGWVLVRMAGG